MGKLGMTRAFFYGATEAIPIHTRSRNRRCLINIYAMNLNINVAEL